jgi:Zn-finger nucleic acid-binding protein
MLVLEVDQVEIDHCLGCGGIWLDSGEVEILLGDPEEASAMLARFESGREKTPGKRKCPICLKKMDTIRIGGEKNITIDSCGKHHGLWFDRGELEDILEIFDTDRNCKIHDLLLDIFKK